MTRKKLPVATRAPRAYSVRMKRDETERMAVLYRAGYSCVEIAAIVGISRQRVRVRLIRHGVEMRDRQGREKTA